MPTCVLVADAGRARIFRANGRGRVRALEELEDLVAPAARLTRRELGSDKAGRVYARSRPGAAPRSAVHSGVAADADPHDADTLRFATTVARRLEARRLAGDFDELRIAAAPRFLGLLRSKLKVPTSRIVTVELARDISRMKPPAIARALFSE